MFSKFKKSYFARAWKVKSDKGFKTLLMNCFKEIARKHKKDIKDVSLEDIYRVVSRLRKLMPGFFKKVTLNQFLKFMKGASKAGDIISIIEAATLHPLFLAQIGLKRVFGTKIGRVATIYTIKKIANDIYGGDKKKTG